MNKFIKIAVVSAALLGFASQAHAARWYILKWVKCTQLSQCR